MPKSNNNKNINDDEKERMERMSRFVGRLLLFRYPADQQHLILSSVSGEGVMIWYDIQPETAAFEKWHQFMWHSEKERKTLTINFGGNFKCVLL